MTRFASLAVVGLLAAGCSSAPPVAKVAARDAADPLLGTTVVVPMPRICLDVQLDEVRNRRRGAKGLPRTRAVDAELRRALQVDAPRSWEELANGCAGSIDSRDPRTALEEVRAPSEVLAKLQGGAAKRAIVTQVTTRLLCPTRSMPSLDQLGYCYEDNVSVSAIVFDESGRPLRVAQIEVDGERDVDRGVRSLLETFHYGGPAESEH